MRGNFQKPNDNYQNFLFVLLIKGSGLNSGSARLDSAWLGTTWLGSDWLGSAQLVLAPTLALALVLTLALALAITLT
jgi:hypothetical protein